MSPPGIKRKPLSFMKAYGSPLGWTALTFFASWLLMNDAQREARLALGFYGFLLFCFYRIPCAPRNLILGSSSEYALSFIFSAASVLGLFFSNDLTFENMHLWMLLEWFFCSIVLTEPVCRILRRFCAALSLLPQKELSSGNCMDSRLPRSTFFFFRKPAGCFLFSLAIILVCWLPVWMAYYPGLWNYDPWQVEQVLSGVYSKHHPLLHTLLLGGCYRFALRLNNPNLGPVLYTLFQMGICAAIFAYACVFVRQHTARPSFFYILCLLFFALFPVHPILMMSTTKDTLFSAFILLACLLFLSMKKSAPSRRKLLTAAEIPVLGLIILFRNNAKYCFFLLLAICLWKIRATSWRRLLAVVTAGTLLGVGTDRALGQILNASPALIAEMCSVPSQMAGRVQEKIDALDSETENFLDRFYSLHELSYNPALADPTKFCLRIESREDLLQYAKESLHLFLRYPTVCLDSFLYTTKGLWDPQDLSHTRIYGTENRQGYLSTDIQPGYQIVPESKLPFLEECYEKLFTENAFLKIPLVHFLFSPAMYVHLLLLCFFILFREKDRRALIIPLFLIFLVLTIALGPGILPRYIYPLMVCAPILIWMAADSIRHAFPHKEKNVSLAMRHPIFRHKSAK